MRTQVCFGVAVVALCAGSFETHASDPESKSARTFVLNGMRKERSLLKSGVCRMEGIWDFDALEGSEYEDWEGKLSILSAFDENGQLRFDRTQPDWVVDPSTAKPDPDHPGRVKTVDTKKGTVTRKYFRNTKRTGFWRIGDPTITLGTLEGKWPGPTETRYFDVKALGLYFTFALDGGLNFNQLIDAYESMQSLSAVDRSDPNVWLLVWSAGDEFSVTEWRMWVDVNHGFTPVRYENRERMTGQDSWWVIQADNTKWDQQDGVWVPIQHEMVITPYMAKWRQETTFDIIWDSINKPIDQDLFDNKGFEAPDSVDVVDISLGTPVVIKEGAAGGSLHQFPLEKQMWRLYFIAINGVVILAIVVALIVKSRKKRTLSI